MIIKWELFVKNQRIKNFVIKNDNPFTYEKIAYWVGGKYVVKKVLLKDLKFSKWHFTFDTFKPPFLLTIIVLDSWYACITIYYQSK